MLCTACNKESKNQRVCPYCFTPYPTDAPPAKRASTRTAQVPASSAESGGAARPSVLPQSPVVRWAGLGIIVVLVLWNLTAPEDGAVEPGAPAAAVAAPAMSNAEAETIIRQTRESALVDVQQDEVFVSYRAATFPVHEEGQEALVKQFAAADATVEGRRRRIFFYNPNGKLFAQSDAVRGVIVVP